MVGKVLRSRLVGSYGGYKFSFLRVFYLDFHSGWTRFHPISLRVSFCPHPCKQSLTLSEDILTGVSRTAVEFSFAFLLGGVEHLVLIGQCISPFENYFFSAFISQVV